MEKETIRHDSYGMIGFSRINSSGKHYFFGSDLPVSNFIEMKVQHAEIDRNLSSDWYHSDSSKPKVLSIIMTPNQFSELITSMNRGDGVPCTIQHINGEEIEQVKFPENRKQYTARAFKTEMNNFAASIKDKQAIVKAISQKKTLSAEDQKQLNWAMDWITQEVTNNVPYFQECFVETMDKVVATAKMEVEGAIMHKINAFGLEAIHNHARNEIFNLESGKEE